MSALPGLIGRMAQQCQLLRLEAVPDGHGGTLRDWRLAGTFEAAVSAVGDTSGEAMATRPDSRATCTLTAPRGTALLFHDRVRTSDGRLLSVISEAKDRHTPVPASFSFERYECEEAIDE